MTISDSTQSHFHSKASDYRHSSESCITLITPLAKESNPSVGIDELLLVTRLVCRAWDKVSNKVSIFYIINDN